MHLKMQRAKDLASYDNRHNLVRMELEQLLKPPDESTLVVAFIQEQGEKLKTSAHFLSTVVVDAFTLDVVIQNVRDSMLIASAPAEQCVFAFSAGWPNFLPMRMWLTMPSLPNFPPSHLRLSISPIQWTQWLPPLFARQVHANTITKPLVLVLTSAVALRLTSSNDILISIDADAVLL
jgi:hypothetical protein